MEIIGLILLILTSIGLSNLLKFSKDGWGAALVCSAIITICIMFATASLTVNKFYKEGVKEYLQHPERYTIKIVYEDSIPVDTIVELK